MNPVLNYKRTIVENITEHNDANKPVTNHRDDSGKTQTDNIPGTPTKDKGLKFRRFKAQVVPVSSTTVSLGVVPQL